MSESWYQRARRRWALAHRDRAPVDRGGRNLLSSNKIAGPSWDVPIAVTCAPSSTCAASCYALNPSKPITWSGAVNRQHLRLSLAEADPQQTAERIANEVKRRGLPHLTIHGTGDLTQATVHMINALAPLIDVPIWVRSRKPHLAAKLNNHKNIYLHFSLDQTSIKRRDVFLRLNPSVQYFFSYQGQPGERITDTHGCALVFADRYDQRLLGSQIPSKARCPLHDLCTPDRPRGSATGACASCRRCFDGSLVSDQQAIAAVGSPAGEEDRRSTHGKNGGPGTPRSVLAELAVDAGDAHRCG